MIELKDVSLRAGKFSLTGINLTVPENHYAVLMGRTGCGKTTLLESICGLKRILHGQLLLHGVDATRLSPADRGIGYVPQDLALFPTKTVYEHLAFALKLRSVEKSSLETRVHQVADQLSIRHLLKRKPQGLSGGEMQRVALGRAISFRPRILLLDEPLSALDRSTRCEIQSMLKEVNRSDSITVLHVTHNEEEANSLSDLILRLDP